jgi:hypothetical protein
MKHLALILLLLTAVAFAAEAPSLLPAQFSGWEKNAVSQASKDPAVADPAFAPLLKEYGFTNYELATYTRPGRKLTVKAARFNDASGAYGAFTFYKAPEMQSEKIGDQGSSANERVLFYRGNILVQALFDRVTAMSAAELRELAAALPLPSGSARNLPSLPTYLPRESYVKNSAKYVMGPVGLNNLESPVPASVVGFDQGAEVAIGKYSSSGGTATIELISYPTPQIAGDRLRAIEALQRQGATSSANFQVKRTGPIVAVIGGDMSANEAKALLTAINYEADVTWNENTFLGKRDNIGNLLVAVIVLTGIILLFALALGLAFGGMRILLKRLFPNRFFDRQEDVEIIRLRLSD